MERKHTPGPWQYFDTERKPIDIGTYECDNYYNNPYLIGADGERVAGCDEYWVIGNQDETGRANAILISAAPDLLAACEAGLQELQTLAQAFGLENFDSNPAVKQLRSAILKATGGAQ